MLSRLLLGALVVLAVAFGVSQLADRPAPECGPVTGTLPADARPTASVDDARAAALVAVPGAVVADVDLDEEDGFLVYEVELTQDRAEFDVVVDAGTGDVLCFERD